MAEIPEQLVRLAGERDALLGQIVRLLEADERVAAAWLLGSFGRGQGDAWSDLDLHVAVEDEHLDAFLAERPALYARAGRPVLVQGEMSSNAMDGAHFQLVVFVGPVEVDWNIGPLSRARRPEASVPLFDRAPVPSLTLPPLSPDQRRERAGDRLVFFWAMAPIAVKYAGRCEARPVARQIELLTQAYIALWRLVHEADGPEPWLPQVINRRLEPELDARLPMLGESVDPRSALAVIRAFCREVEALHPALAALGVPIPAAMPDQVRSIAAVADAAIECGGPPRRSFR